jgi:hypothetical protein
MWTTIKYFEKPASLEDACSLIVRGQKVVFSGGSYLAAEQSADIDTLIAINHLLDDRIEMNDSVLTIGAGATLQNLIQFDSNNSSLRLAECARWSCPSRNIRNQRTIGGEVGCQRTNSELFTYLQALDVRLEIMTPTPQSMSIREWDGQGIITALQIDLDTVKQTFCQRFALIPSAPAVVMSLLRVSCAHRILTWLWEVPPASCHWLRYRTCNLRTRVLPGLQPAHRNSSKPTSTDRRRTRNS